MRRMRAAVLTLGMLAAANCVLLAALLELPPAATAAYAVLSAVLTLYCCLRPTAGDYPAPVLRRLDGGSALLAMGLRVETVSAVFTALAGIFYMPARFGAGTLIGSCAVVLAATGLLLAAGLVRAFASSAQMGVRWRVALILLWWVPLANIALFARIRAIARDEYRFETARWELDHARAENAVCRTKYPILLVHGVFFRDSRFFNYWGRVPAELIRNGAAVFYGEQQSAASVEDSAKELAARIRAVAEQSGTGKVNIIAHSKGGLDARLAISRLGAAPYAASLTTINTPHRGCLFAEYLLGKTSQKFQQGLADTYNAALKKLGDANPDFLAAVRDLTKSACDALNEKAPDMPGVLYESVGSKVRRARSGQFPLNVSYPLVRHFDGENDGLVAVEAAKWGTAFTLLTPKGRRGISHGDVIDLNRENIPGFDVREFYVQLVRSLKERGY